jgi:uncharacterized protein
MGMRRVGKTWFCYQKIFELLEKNIPKNRILYFNFEDERLVPNFTVESFDIILQEYYRLYPDNKNNLCYFFFDEIQNINGWELFIRRVIDSEKIKLTLTGSNSKLLSREISTSLRGRSISTEIFPLSFSEFMNFHDIHLSGSIYSSKNEALLRNAFDKYFNLGGFPEIQYNEESIRITLLQEYVNTVLFKDTIERYKIKNTNAVRLLIYHIMNNPCKELSINKFYNTLRSLQISSTKDKLYEYLTYLEDAYLIYKVELYSNSLKIRQHNPPKIYVIDNSILKAMSYKITSDFGHLLENMVFMHLRRKSFIINYYKDKNGFETDFVVRKHNGELVDLIQVCYDLSDNKTKQREIRGLTSAMKNLQFNTGKIITFNTDSKLEDNIQAISAWKWMYEEISL